MSATSTTYVLAPDVELPEEGAGVADVVYLAGENRYVRVGPGALRLLRAAREPVTDTTLAQRSGRPLGDPAVIDAIARLQLEGLLARAAEQRAPAPRRPGRFRVIGPFMVQFDLLEPTRLIDALAAVARRIGLRRLAAAQAAVLLLGLLALVLQLGDLLSLLHRQVTLLAGLLAITAVVTTTFVHELAHGLVLRLVGGVPRRVGIMLFYGVPGLFCDVSDAWRVADPRSRCAVCLAGIATQATGAAACALGAAFTAGDVGDGLLLAAVSNAVIAVANLLPFLKLDGYLAIVALTGHSDLRATCLGELKRASAWLLAGGERPRVTWGRIAFGIGCAATPVLVILSVADAYNTALRGLGVVGAALQLLVSALLVVIVLMLLRVFARALRDQLGSRVRLAAAGAVAAVAVVAALAVPVATEQVVPFVVRGGEAHLVVRTEGLLDEVTGRPARLLAPALLPSDQVAIGRVGDAGALARTAVPIDAGSPVRADARLERPTLTVPVTGATPPSTREGIARVRAEPRAFGVILWQRGARDPARTIWAEVSAW